jgi:hypothetical protein
LSRLCASRSRLLSYPRGQHTVPHPPVPAMYLAEPGRRADFGRRILRRNRQNRGRAASHATLSPSRMVLEWRSCCVPCPAVVAPLSAKDPAAPAPAPGRGERALGGGRWDRFQRWESPPAAVSTQWASPPRPDFPRGDPAPPPPNQWPQGAPAARCGCHRLSLGGGGGGCLASDLFIRDKNQQKISYCSRCCSVYMGIFPVCYFFTNPGKKIVLDCEDEVESPERLRIYLKATR